MHAALAALVTLALAQAPVIPSPSEDPRATTAREHTAILAGGCFWGLEAVFERLHGVTDVVSGFAGRGVAGPLGPMPAAEVVKITYDPSKVSYGTLLRIFFGIAHDPTELNRQGPDEGPQYRSSIFYVDDDQRRVAEAYIRQLEAARLFPRKIVTTIVPFDRFQLAGPEHQDFVARNPTAPYVQFNDAPKIAHLEKDFPQLLKRR